MLQVCVVVVVVCLAAWFFRFIYHYWFYYFIVPCWKLGSPYPSKAHSSRKSSATHSYQCVQYFRVSQRRPYGCQCWGFLTCAQMLMHAISHGGCTDIVSLHRELTLGEKSLASRGTRTRVSIAPGGFSVGRSTH